MSITDNILDIINEIEDVFINCLKDDDNRSVMNYLATRVDELDEKFIKLEKDVRKKYFDMIEEAMNGCYVPRQVKTRNDTLVEKPQILQAEKAQSWLDFWNNALYFDEWGFEEPEFNDDVVSIGKYARYVLEPDEAISYVLKKMDEVRENYEKTLRLPFQNASLIYEQAIRDTIDKSTEYLAKEINYIQEGRYIDNTEEAIIEWDHSFRFLAYCLQKLGKTKPKCEPILKKLKKNGLPITKKQFRGAWNQVENGWKENGKSKQYNPDEDLKHLRKEKSRLSRLF